MTELNEYEWATLSAIGNALIPAMDTRQLKYKALYEDVLEGAPRTSALKLRLMLHVLSFRATAVGFTRSHLLLSEMDPADARTVLLGFADSIVPALRMLFAALLNLTMLAWCRGDPEMLARVGYAKVHPNFRELQAKADSWTPISLALPPAIVADVPTALSADVVIVGSGCSSMVAAYRLAKEGYKVLILEKGGYINATASPDSDFARNKLAFEAGGSMPSVDSSIFLLAGSTVGGGGAVNWSCSLRTPENIRKEWVARGAPFYGESVYDDALNEVERVMQVTHDVNPHSFTNQMIMDTAAKLAYPASVTGQNTGKHHPNSGFHEFGSRRGENEGGVAEWLRFAIDHGAQLLGHTEVVRIRHQNGRASGVDAVYAGGRRLVISAKRVVCASGSLHTPLLLQRSKFRNKLIGQGLKLHPVTLAFGEFPQVVNKRTDQIMTAVSTVSDNLDGKGHGPKLEAIHHQPHLIFSFLPYKSADDYQRKIESYSHLSSVLIITRDRTDGKVSYDPKKPQVPVVDYTTNDYDMWALKQGAMSATNMLYVYGAERIFLSSRHLPEFTSTKPKEERSIWDPDYRNWLNEVANTKFMLYDTRVGSAHQMASCRISDKGPKYGPVDAKGHLYECSNVHVIDTSVFPTASGVNPMISCMATSYVLSGYLLDDLRKLATKL